MSRAVPLGGITLLSLLACTDRPRDGASNTPADCASPAPAARDVPPADDDHAEERRAISASGRRVFRSPGTLRITARNGRVLAFTDTIVEGDRYLRYVYTQYLPALGAHVVHERYYEGSADRFISESTARDTLLASAPIRSPDSRRFAVASLDLFAGYDPSVLEIWRVEGDRVVREFALDGGDSWGPDSVAWTSADTLRFLRATVAPGTVSYAYTPHCLIRRAETWAVEPPIP